MSLRPAGVAALTLLVVGFGCGGGDGGTPPKVRGDLTVTYVSSGRDLGAVLLTVSGGEVEDVSAILAGVVVSFASPTPGVTRLVVSGALVSGDLLKVRVPDLNDSDSYFLRIDQIADTETFALLDPSLASFTIRR